MSVLKSILQHLKFYSIANILGKGANVFLFLFIAKVFSVEDFAQYVKFLIVIELMLVLLLFGVDSYIMRTKNKFSFNITIEFIKLNAAISIFILLFIILIYSTNLISTSEFFLFCSLDAYLLFRTVEKLFANYLIRTQQSKKFLKITLISSYSQLAIVLMAYYVGILGIASYFIILSLPLMILILFLMTEMKNEEFSLSNKIVFKLKIDTIQSSMKAAFPFLGKNMIGSINLYSSRIILAAFATPFGLAAYSFYLALYFKAVGLMSVVSRTFIPMMKDRIDKIGTIHSIVRKFELPYIFIIIFTATILMIVYDNSLFQNMLTILIKSEYLDMLDLGLIFIICFFVSLATMIYDFWQYSLKNVAKKILTISTTIMFLSIIGYMLILQSYGTREIALFYLFINIVMLIVSRMFFYQIKPS